ncbi:MAG TPA: Ku protein [Nitrospiraceae bacterium]
MGRKLETAHISFGLVTIPVGIYPAIDEQDIHFNQLHARCGSRIKQQRICPVCNCEVPMTNWSKGMKSPRISMSGLTRANWTNFERPNLRPSTFWSSCP